MSSNEYDIAIIIPANNEEAFIDSCLSSLLAQDAEAGKLQIIVAANACTDGTESIVDQLVPAARARRWELICQSNPEPGKLNALNRADALVRARIRAYLDADVLCDPELFGQLRAALDRSEPTYATGTIEVARAKSWATRAYARIWTRLPFVQDGTVGAGLFAVNASGRARWREFPSIIADDTFARLNFSPEERVEVPARYHWPMVEGIRNLIRVRRRQDAGVLEVYRHFPQLRANENKRAPTALGLIGLLLRFPLGFAIYSIVHVAVRLQPSVSDWRRGR